MAAERKRIGLRDVRMLEPGGTVWDTAVAGFCARRQHSEAIAYCLKYRTADGRQRWHTIGRHGAPWTPDDAREEARRLLGDVTKGADPAADKRSKRQSATVAELCDLYLADADAGRLLTRRGGTKKASTILTDRSRITAHQADPWRHEGSRRDAGGRGDIHARCCRGQHESAQGHRQETWIVKRPRRQGRIKPDSRAAGCPVHLCRPQADAPR